MTEFVLDENLRPFASEGEWAALDAWARLGSARAAARELGTVPSYPVGCRDRVLRKAARRGYAPDYAAFSQPEAKVPPGFVLRGQSVLLDSDGTPVKRWDKTTREGADPEEARRLPDPKRTRRLSTQTDAEGRVLTQWQTEEPLADARERAWRAFAEELAADLPRAEPLPQLDVGGADEILVGYPIADAHLGMLSWREETGEDYDLKIGEERLRKAMSYLTASNGGAGHALVAFLGDLMHYDSFESVTPASRNQLDSDTRYPKMVRAAVRVMRYSVDIALRAHGQVRVIVETGNHDLSSSIFLQEALRAVYEREPRVSVDTSPAHCHYYRFGKILIGTHHGHAMKMRDLPLTMASDRPEDWGRTTYRHWWTGHVHHASAQPATSAKDYSGCYVESFRTLAAPDAWATQQGHRPRREMQAILYHAEHGPAARTIFNPEMLE